MNAYPGRLGAASGSDAGFRVKVYLGDDRIEIVSFESERWSWRLDELTVTRSGAGRFALQLAEERIQFVPDEPIRFAAGITDHMDGHDERRGWLRRRIEEARHVVPAETPVGEVEFVEDPEPRATQRRRKQHEHEWDEASSVGVLRRRCVGCGHVSIDITGFVSEFDLAPAEPVSIEPPRSFAEAV